MRDIVRERWLDKLVEKYEYVRDYNLEDADWGDKAASQVRLDGTSDEHIEDFARVALAGEARDLPPVIVYRNGGPKDDGCDGFHRGKGLPRGGVGVHDAYVITECDPLTLDIVRRTANIVLNGKGFSTEERLRHAAFVKSKYPERPLVEIAAYFGIADTTLGSFIAREDTKLVLAEKGVPSKIVNQLNKTHLDAISRHRPSVQVALAECIVLGKMKGAEAVELARQVDASDSEADAMGLIRSTREQYATRNRKGTATRLPTTEWKRAINTLRSAMRDLQGRTDGLTQLQRREVADTGQSLSLELAEFVSGVL